MHQSSMTLFLDCRPEPSDAEIEALPEPYGASVREVRARFRSLRKKRKR